MSWIKGFRIFIFSLSLASMGLILYDIYDNWSLYQTAYYMRPQNQRRTTTVEKPSEEIDMIMVVTPEPEARLAHIREVCPTVHVFICTGKAEPKVLPPHTTWYHVYEWPASVWQVLLAVPAHRVFFLNDNSYLLANPFISNSSVFWPRPQSLTEKTLPWNLQSFLIDRKSNYISLEALLWCFQSTPSSVLSDEDLFDVIESQMRFEVGGWRLVDGRYQCCELDGKPIVVTDIIEGEFPPLSRGEPVHIVSGINVEYVYNRKNDQFENGAVVWCKGRYYLAPTDDRDIRSSQLHKING